MKNVLKRECNKGKHGSQIKFHVNFILLILILRLFFPINHHGAEVSVISFVERSAIKLLILIHY